MRCRVVQRRLLELENPAEPPVELVYHLAVCSECQTWQRRLVRIERNVPLLPVPASSAPAGLVDRLSAPRVPPGNGRTRLPRLPDVRSRQFAVPAAVAAAVLFSLVSWWALREPASPSGTVVKNKPAAPDPLVAKVMDRDVRLAEAKTPRERVEALADLADDLRKETQTLATAAGPEDLDKLAALYQKVVRDGIVQRARDLPRADRGRVLYPIADRLDRARGDAEMVARATPQAAGPLQAIAAAARDGKGKLDGLIREVAR